MTPERLAGWVPIRVSWRDARPHVVIDCAVDNWLSGCFPR